jgi:hypothetical protein
VRSAAAVACKDFLTPYRRQTAPPGAVVGVGSHGPIVSSGLSDVEMSLRLLPASFNREGCIAGGEVDIGSAAHLGLGALLHQASGGVGHAPAPGDLAHAEHEIARLMSGPVSSLFCGAPLPAAETWAGAMRSGYATNSGAATGPSRSSSSAFAKRPGCAALVRSQPVGSGARTCP